MRSIAYILLSLATLALYLAMGIWTLPEITQEADGLLPFDLRPFGYSELQAEDFLNALSDEGRALYAGLQHDMDRVYPALLFAWFWLTFVRLWHPPVLWGLLFLAGVGCAADYAENAAVAQLLDGFDSQVARWASLMTMLKSAAVTVAFIAVLWGLVARLRGRRAG